VTHTRARARAHTHTHTFGKTPGTSISQNTHHSQERGFYASGGIRTYNPSKRAAADLRLRSRGHRVPPFVFWEMLLNFTVWTILIPDFYEVGWGTTIVCWA